MRFRIAAVIALAISAIAGEARAAPCAGFVDVDDAIPSTSAFCQDVVWIRNRGVTLGCTPTQYCPFEFVSRLQMAAFMRRLGEALFPSTCAAGQLLKWDGAAWRCANDDASIGNGTVISIASGTGLAGAPNPLTAAGSIGISPSYRLPQPCTSGQVPKSNGSGGWACAADASSGGTVTNVATGTGLTGGPITTNGTVAINTATYWHALRNSGVEDRVAGFGKLLAEH